MGFHGRQRISKVLEGEKLGSDGETAAKIDSAAIPVETKPSVCVVY
jgi:hypothetical protein